VIFLPAQSAKKSFNLPAILAGFFVEIHTEGGE
jgi:hypothetical protein